MTEHQKAVLHAYRQFTALDWAKIVAFFLVLGIAQSALFHLIAWAMQR